MKEDDKIRLFRRSASQFHVLKGTFASILMNCQAVSFSLHAWLGVCSFFGRYPGDNNYGKLKISVAIPK